MEEAELGGAGLRREGMQQKEDDIAPRKFVRYEFLVGGFDEGVAGGEAPVEAGDGGSGVGAAGGFTGAPKAAAQTASAQTAGAHVKAVVPDPTGR